MSSEFSKDPKTQEKSKINGGHKILDLVAISNPELMESSVSISSDESDGREVILSEGILDLQNCDETMNHHTTITDLPHDVLMIIFDNLTPCMTACLGLTCSRFYITCKIHRPEPFNLSLHDTKNHHCVTQKYRPETICNPLSCVYFSCDNGSLASSEPEEDAMLILEISRHQVGNIPATPYPRRDHLADLIETWQGLRHY
ncbi:predicted protein [Sclerotinia sclerotiorum 1980 UF-70]|uniref:F-box domain-containing protein n=2 Tax=Sclerotinia sclerotiorum (strain ATCC 18683 / 1980 / Ss-1) TaxID=665079 RepID=A7EBB2_SCLS1|nr:predicted protein [Sclerotinia sclerotiorum 1980 UF-70]APA08806.1 hypothetical protein sscle_04g035760 [Sclerotinia sclerotiorum 1980 UF-70]EDN99740.1 predicted protein [Sclerotinia sclerotiorum 1980 UF-70]